MGRRLGPRSSANNSRVIVENPPFVRLWTEADLFGEQPVVAPVDRDPEGVFGI
jgi:hypothetical protein